MVLLTSKINANLAEAIIEKILCTFSPLLLTFLPNSDCLFTGLATKVKITTLISRKSLLHKLICFICFQAVAAPALASSFLATIRSPKTYLLIPLDALKILTFMFIPFFLLLDDRRISLVIFNLV